MIPMLLWCPECGRRHVDEGEYAAKAEVPVHCHHGWLLSRGQCPRCAEEDAHVPEYVRRARERHPNAYRPWNDDLDRLLRDHAFVSRTPIDELVRVFGRTSGAIGSRLEHLGLSYLYDGRRVRTQTRVRAVAIGGHADGLELEAAGPTCRYYPPVPLRVPPPVVDDLLATTEVVFSEYRLETLRTGDRDHLMWIMQGMPGSEAIGRLLASYRKVTAD